MNTFDRLAKILLKTYPVDPATLTPDRRLEELGVDSLGVGLMLFDIEDEFKIKFNRDPGSLQTLADVVSFIEEVVDGQIREPRLHDAPSIRSP